MLAFSGKPISSIKVLPTDSPISQTCLDIIRRKPNRNVRTSSIAGDSVSKPSPANIALRH